MDPNGQSPLRSNSEVTLVSKKEGARGKDLPTIYLHNKLVHIYIYIYIYICSCEHVMSWNLFLWVAKIWVFQIPSLLAGQCSEASEPQGWSRRFLSTLLWASLDRNPFSKTEVGIPMTLRLFHQKNLAGSQRFKSFTSVGDCTGHFPSPTSLWRSRSAERDE